MIQHMGCDAETSPFVPVKKAQENRREYGVERVPKAALWRQGKGEEERAATFVSEVLELAGDGSFAIEVVGESYHQDALERICGGRTRDGADHRCSAALVLDNANRFDPMAVRVEIEGLLVGYLPRDLARAFRRALAKSAPRATVVRCPAWIRGGWDRGDGDRGDFGVRLDLG